MSDHNLSSYYVNTVISRTHIVHFLIEITYSSIGLLCTSIRSPVHKAPVHTYIHTHPVHFHTTRHKPPPPPPSSPYIQYTHRCRCSTPTLTQVYTTHTHSSSDPLTEHHVHTYNHHCIVSKYIHTCLSIMDNVCKHVYAHVHTQATLCSYQGKLTLTHSHTQCLHVTHGNRNTEEDSTHYM